MDPRLRITVGADKGKSYLLPPSRAFTIGNVPQESEICLQDAKLSRAHCRIQNADGCVVVNALHGAAGMFVNGERVTKSELHHGDVLKIGDTELAYESIGAWNVPSEPGDPKSSNASALDATVIFDVPRAHEHVSLTDLGLPPTPTSLDDVQRLANTGFGRFELGPVIGTGHYGVVFRARRSHEGPDLALKVLDPSFPHTPDEATHFKTVMQPRLSVRHPNLVTVTGIGRQLSCTWLALELIEGESLAHMVAQFETTGLPDWTEAYRLAVHLARALHVATRHHLVHRNLTPANVLYRRLDHLFKLSDLPLAQALAGSHLRQTTLRAKSRAEIAYASPEQLQPQSTPDIRSDLYSLGALVYLMLSGKPPLVGKTPAETMALIRDTEPVPPRQHQASIPERFADAVLTLLAKRPEDRFGTPADLLMELAKITPDPA